MQNALQRLVQAEMQLEAIIAGAGIEPYQKIDIAAGRIEVIADRRSEYGQAPRVMGAADFRDLCPAGCDELLHIASCR